MFSRIETIPAKKLIGMSRRMTLAENTTPLLWKDFMPRRKEITHNVDGNLISMQVYNPPFDVRSFNMQTPFDKWATVEVADNSELPEGMEPFLLPGGSYAVFEHRGGPAKGAEAFQYIFAQWLPASGYELDNRPHFEVLGERYKGNDPDSEEEIWIPVRLK